MTIGQSNREASPPEQAVQVVHRHLIAFTGLLGMLAVLIGAFGAHGLEDFLVSRYGLSDDQVAKRLDQFDVGARYHLAHSVTLLAICLLPGFSPRAIRLIASFMVAGIALFSGSLYLLVATNTPWLGAVTPIGGVCWIVGWLAITVSAVQSR